MIFVPQQKLKEQRRVFKDCPARVVVGPTRTGETPVPLRLGFSFCSWFAA